MEELRARFRHRRPLGRSLRKAAWLVFGTTAAARQAVGVPVERPRAWSRERVIDELRATGGKPGTIDSVLEAACRRYFGSITEARRVAGVPVQRKWTRQRIIDELRATGGKSGAFDGRFSKSCRYYFGSIDEARRAAGVPARSRWTRERVIDELRAAWDAGLPLADPVEDAARRLFGSMNAAREAAGLPIKQRRTWTKRELLDELRDRWRSRAIDDRHAEWLCVKYFGSVNAARRAAGLSAMKRAWTKREVLDELRENWRDRGVDDQSVARACDRYFGGVAAARRAAGLPIYRAGNERAFAVKTSRDGNHRRRRARR